MDVRIKCTRKMYARPLPQNQVLPKCSNSNQWGKELLVSFVYVHFTNFWTPFTICLPRCGIQNNISLPTQDAYSLIPEAYEYAMLHSKGQLRLQMKLRLSADCIMDIQVVPI